MLGKARRIKAHPSLGLQIAFRLEFSKVKQVRPTKLMQVEEENITACLAILVLSTTPVTGCTARNQISVNSVNIRLD